MRYYAPTTIEEAVQAITAAGPGAQVIAGGTDVVSGLRNGKLEPPEALISLANVTELCGIEVGADEVVIGATTRIADLLFSADLAEALPALPTVADQMASPQIRNMATLGGNLCNASPAADTVVPLLVLGAELEIARHINGEVQTRVAPLAGFHAGPGESHLGTGELLTAIRIPRPPADFAFGFQKFGRRPALHCSVVTVGIGARRADDGTLSEVKVALGAVAPTPLLATATAAALEGKRPEPEVVAAAARAAEGEINPIDDVRGSAQFRRDLIGALVTRAVEELAQPAQAEQAAPLWPTLPNGDAICGGRHQAPTSLSSGSSEAKEHTVPIAFTVNGDAVTAEVSPRLPLIELLREEFGLLGTKLGCGEGECGSCTVIVDGASVNGCLYLAVAADGRELLTIEGLATGGQLDPIQEAFVQHGAVQCGFCTPGMIMQTWWLLQTKVALTDQAVRRGIEGNLCRCTGYLKILEAIQSLDGQAAPATAKEG